MTLMNRTLIPGSLAGALFVLACGGTGDTETIGGTSMATSTTAGPTSDDETETSNTTTEPTTNNPFMPFSDGLMIGDCNTYEENCPGGTKCMPYADDGGTAWNALMCTEVYGKGVHGDPCTVEGRVSGIDDCALHHMCWDVDPETNMGHCVSFCDGSPENAACDEPDTFCFVNNGGVLNICLPICEPLVQDCPESQGCYPIDDNYACFPIAVPDDVGFEGDSCNFINACQSGFACIAAEQLPTCEDTGCCAPFCDLTEQDPCSNPEVQCIAVYEENESDPNVGFCGVMP